MFDRFTDRARKVMGLSKAAADRLDHDFIGTEHVLLAVVDEGSGIAIQVLKRLGIDGARIRGEIDGIVRGVPRNGKRLNTPFTPTAKMVLELALEEASGLGHNYVGTEHLLLGLIKEGDGIAARVLSAFGATLEKTRDEIVRYFGSDRSPFPRNAVMAEEVRRVLELRGARVTSQADLSLPSFSPPKSALRIGVIGAGGIVQNAHLPAYAKFHYEVSAICDVDRAAAEAAAKKFGIGTVCATVDELLARKDVDVVDVAIPEHGRPMVLPKIVAARKPALLQKPLAYTLEEAKRIVAEFERAKVPLAVNQNLRWSPEFRAAKHLITSGALGQVFDLRWTMRNTSDRRDWAKGSWYSRDPRFQVLSWSIHELDAFRFLLDDEAERVYCALPRRPDQNFVGDAAATAVIHFKNGCHVSMVDSNVSTPGRPEVQLLDVDGSEGSLTFSIAEPRYFVYWLAKEIEAKPNGDAPAHVAKLDGVWYPDGFAGAMGDFLEAVEQGREPAVSGRRNLGTMALVDACYRSAAAKQAVTLE